MIKGIALKLALGKNLVSWEGDFFGSLADSPVGKVCSVTGMALEVASYFKFAFRLVLLQFLILVSDKLVLVVTVSLEFPLRHHVVSREGNFLCSFSHPSVRVL